MKKILSIVLAIATLLSIATLGTSAATVDTAQTATTYYVSSKQFENINTSSYNVYGYLGDIDNDKDLSIMDATSIQMYIAKLVTLNATATLLADTDRDGDISVIDATSIQCFIAKLSTASKVGHTLYSKKENVSASMFDQVVKYIKANSEYEPEYGWYYCYNPYYDYDDFVSLIYFPEENEISISSNDIYLTATADGNGTYLASKYDGYTHLYDAFGDAKLVNKNDRKLKLTNYIFEVMDGDKSLTFAKCETEIQANINKTLAECEKILGSSINGSIYTLFY